MSLWAAFTQFGSAAAATAIFLWLVPKADRETRLRRPEGLAWIVGIVVFGAVFHLHHNLASYDYYRLLLPQLPDWMVPIRFTVSIALRLAFLTAAGGLLLLKERYRRFAIRLWAFNLAAAYFKHPFVTIERAMKIGLHIVGQRGAEQRLLDWPHHAHVLYAGIMIWELTFSALVLIYLTRPGIRDRFR